MIAIVGRGRLCALCLLATLLAGFPAAASAQALGDIFVDDLDQTIECRKLLLEDPILGPLNLGVRVRGRVAILWGPTPSAEIGQRAEQCLRTMIELADVKSEMHVAPDYDWRPPPGLPLAPLLPEDLPPALPDPVRPAAPRVGGTAPADLARR
jgi:hypothetical protein